MRSHPLVRVNLLARHSARALIVSMVDADSMITQPRPQGLLLDDFQNGGSTGEWNHVVQNLQKSWRFLSRDILRKPKQNGGEGEAKHRSKDALTLYTRQRWLRSKIKYYFNGCFDSGAGIFSICKFIPLSYSLYF